MLLSCTNFLFIYLSNHRRFFFPHSVGKSKTPTDTCVSDTKNCVTLTVWPADKSEECTAPDFVEHHFKIGTCLTDVGGMYKQIDCSESNSKHENCVITFYHDAECSEVAKTNANSYTIDCTSKKICGWNNNEDCQCHKHMYSNIFGTADVKCSLTGGGADGNTPSSSGNTSASGSTPSSDSPGGMHPGHSFANNGGGLALVFICLLMLVIVGLFFREKIMEIWAGIVAKISGRALKSINGSLLNVDGTDNSAEYSQI